MTPRKLALAAALIFSALTAHPQTMTAGMFTFDFSLDSGGFFSSTGSSTARNTLSLAGSFVTSIISGTTVNAITPSGSDSWTPTYVNPNTLSSVTGTTNLTISSNTFVVYAGGATNSTLGGGFGTALAQTTQGGYSASTGGGTASTAWSNALQYRGNGTNNVPWGGSMSFNSNTASWYYDNDTSLSANEIPSGSYDFFSVAVHELFHLLGFGATSGAYSTTWNSKLSGTNFTGSNAVALYGSNVPLASSSDKAHWAEGTSSFSMVSGSSQETMMDPTIGTGIRKYPTTLDAAAMRDLGYTTNAIPEPADFAAIVAGTALVVGCLRRRSKQRTTAAS